MRFTKTAFIVIFTFILLALTVSAENNSRYINIENVRFDISGIASVLDNNGETIDEKARPGDDIKISVTVENLFDKDGNSEVDIDDAKVEITIDELGEDDEDLELKSSEKDITYEGNDQSRTFDFEFNVPKTAKDDSYPMEIRVTGYDENNTKLEQVWNVDFIVKREKYDLVIDRFGLIPEELECIRTGLIEFDIINMGLEDEDYMHYTLKNPELNINFEETLLKISADPDDEDNIFKKSVPIDMTGKKSGEYKIELKVYRDFDLIESVSGKILTIKECRTNIADTSSDNSQTSNTDDNEETSNDDTQINNDQDNSETETNENSAVINDENNIDNQETSNDDSSTEYNDNNNDQEIDPTSNRSNLIVLGKRINKNSFFNSEAYIIILVLINAFIFTAIILFIAMMKKS